MALQWVMAPSARTATGWFPVARAAEVGTRPVPVGAGGRAYVVVRLRPGRQAKGKCRPTAKAGKRCTLRSPVEVLRQTGTRGLNQVAFRMNRLAPGRYEAMVTATAGTGKARATTGFTIVR